MKGTPRLYKVTPLVLQYDATRLSADLILERLNEPPIGTVLLLSEYDGKSLSLSHLTKSEPIAISMSLIQFGHDIRGIRYVLLYSADLTQCSSCRVQVELHDHARHHPL